MKLIRSVFYPVIILLALLILNACKAKKMAYEPAPFVSKSTSNLPDPVEQQNTRKATVPPPAPAPAPAPAPTPQPTPAPAASFSFRNIQFEFNSGILKTDSYTILDDVSSAMRANSSVKIVLKGYASAEGTADHNMELSVARANAVKSYLVNSGVPDANLIAKGFGENNPVADNTTESGKILNRRVEIKIQN